MTIKILPEKLLFFFLLLVLLVGALLRALFVDFSDFDYGVLSDHFINGVTARNITRGLGWSSSGYETYLLNPENLTLGPTVMLPMVGALYLFGNHLPVISLAMLCLNTSLLLWLLFALRSHYASDDRYFLAATALLALFVFFKSYYWYRMLGEIPALLLLALAALYLHRYFIDNRIISLVVAGVAAFLAAGTKELTVLPLLVLLACLMANAFFSTSVLTRRQKIFHCFLFAIFAFSHPLLFLWYRESQLALMPADWQAAYRQYESAIHAYYSGTLVLKEYLVHPWQFADIFSRVSKASLWNGASLLHFSFAGMRGLYFWLIVFSGVFLFLLLRYRLRIFLSYAGLLALMAAPLLLWYFGVSEKAMPRHLYIGLMLAILSILFYLPDLSLPRLRYFLLLCALSFLVYTGDRASRNTLLSWPLSPSAFSQSVADTQAYIEKSPAGSLAWIGMMDNNEFEFLSPSPNGFISAYDAIARASRFDERAFLDKYPGVRQLLADGYYPDAFTFYVSPENRGSRVAPVQLVQELQFDWLHIKGEIAQFQRPDFYRQKGQLCDELVFQNQYYVVERCYTRDIQRLLDQSGGLPARPRLWTPYILFPSERPEIL